LLTVIAALMLASGAANAERVHRGAADSGFVMVICSDGVAKTVVFDSTGNPVETSDEEVCVGQCACCTVPESDGLPPYTPTATMWVPLVTAEVFRNELASLRSECGPRPNARGPPLEEDA
jgi:hypothetical protein